jgi:hypothetical protein
MRFTRAKFTALFADGVQELDGFAFDVADRKLIAHLARPELRPVDKGYRVSERTSGFPINNTNAPTRAASATLACNAMPQIGDDAWQRSIAMAVRAMRDAKKAAP